MKKLLCLLLTVTMLFGTLTSCLPVGARHEETEATTDPTATESPTTTAKPDDGKPRLLYEFPICTEDNPDCFYQIEGGGKFFTNFDHMTNDEMQAKFDDGFYINCTIVFDYPCLDFDKIPVRDRPASAQAYYSTNNRRFAEEIELTDKYRKNSSFYLSVGQHQATVRLMDLDSYERDKTYLQNIAQDPCVRYVILSLEKVVINECDVNNTPCNLYMQ